jgi:hypothetical protein
MTIVIGGIEIGTGCGEHHIQTPLRSDEARCSAAAIAGCDIRSSG